MAEYIEREAFVESQHNIYCVNCDRRKNSKGKFVYFVGDAPCRACGIMDVLDAVEDFPSADVRPVVRGNWIMTMERFAPERICSSCKCRFPVAAGEGVKEVLNFCPNCGAMMEES